MVRDTDGQSLFDETVMNSPFCGMGMVLWQDCCFVNFWGVWIERNIVGWSGVQRYLKNFWRE